MFNFFFFNFNFNFILFYLTFFNRRIKAAPFLRQNCLLQSGSVVSPIHCELKAWSVSCHLDHIFTSRCQATVWQKREVSLTVIEILLTIFTYSKLAIIFGFCDRFSFFVFFFLNRKCKEEHSFSELEIVFERTKQALRNIIINCNWKSNRIISIYIPAWWSQRNS